MNQRAARAIALHARDTDDARFLLDVVGLVDGPDGREVLADDTRPLPLASFGSPGSGADEPPARRTAGEPPARGVTTPPGLRVLPPAAAPDLMSALRASVERKPAAAPRQRRTAQCGTTSGYEKHRRDRTPACEPCSRARADYQRSRYQSRPPRDRRPACGTRGGYNAHRRRGEPTCTPCREAATQYQQQWAARRAQQTSERAATTRGAS